jgi:long-chain acyl-CoA synthetase
MTYHHPTLLSLIEQRQACHKPLLVQDDETLSAQAFMDQVRRLASALKHQFGIVPGERVGLLFWNETEFLVGLFACRWVGAVIVPFNVTMSATDLLYVVGHSKIKLLAGSADLLGQLAGQAGIDPAHIPFPVIVSNNAHEALATLPQWQTVIEQSEPDPSPHVDPDAMAILMYTSGTTGHPKGVMLSERNLLANMEAFMAMLHLEADTVDHRMLVGIPLFHSYGLMVALYGLAMGATLILVPKFQPKRLLQALQDKQVTILPLVPTLFHVVAAQADKMPPHAFESLVCCISGGAALAPDLLAKVETLLSVPVLEGYGLTETSPVISVNTPTVGSVPGTVGQPLTNLTVRLQDKDTLAIVPVEMGQASGIGEIQVQGPSVMLGYYQADDLTAEVMTEDGFFKTGDLGQFDPAGNLRIVGRIKELIIKAGENISPIPIEQVVHKAAHVADVAVVGQPDAKMGERIVAFVSIEEGADEATVMAEMKQVVRQHLAPLHQPDSFRILAALPKSPTGKIMKKVLRQQLVEEASASVGV